MSEKPTAMRQNLFDQESGQVVAMVEVRSAQPVAPFDENLLERARTQWQFGDWKSLAALDRSTLQHHPDRAKLAALAAAGRLQTGKDGEAREYVRLADRWGASKKLISQILISAIHNSLGRAAAIDNQERRALQHFEESVSIGAPACDIRLLVQARSEEQSRQLALCEADMGAARPGQNGKEKFESINIKPSGGVPEKRPFDVTGANKLISGISLTEQSRKRWPYFLKIEELQISVFLQLVADTQPVRFFDIGANVGFYTLIAQKYFPTLHCIAFEPTPDTFSNLLENIKENGRDGCAEARCLALSSNHGFAEFGDFGDCSGKNGIMSTSIHEQNSLKSRIRVEMESLDREYSEGQGRIIVKIDAEGHEMEIIQGGLKFFAQNEVILQIETGHKENSDELDRLIQGCGLAPIFKLGPDSYYTNIPDLIESSKTSQLLERANRFVIAHRWDIEQSFD
jgi:FkbM family methyltransferase